MRGLVEKGCLDTSSAINNGKSWGLRGTLTVRCSWKKLSLVERSRVGGWGASRELCLSRERSQLESIVFGCQAVPIVSNWETKVCLIEVEEKSEEKAEKEMREERQTMKGNTLKGEKGGG